MHGLFGAVRLYVVAADPVASHLAHHDDDSGIPFRDGAWATWAGKGESRDLIDPPLTLSRVTRVVHIGAALLPRAHTDAVGPT
jgi:hypothetical protein